MISTDMGKRVEDVPRILNTLGPREKDMGLEETARTLLDNEEEILTANREDCDRAEAGGMNQGFLDRLRLTPARVQTTAGGPLQATSLDDPVGKVFSMKLRPDELQIGQKRVPLGVIGMIYGAHPNVTADAFGLCSKSGNAVILRDGSDALSSNRAIMEALRTGLSRVGLPEDSLQLIEDTSRETTKELMHLNRYIDVPIPRGGTELIYAVVGDSIIPVIETGIGNCYVYVDEAAGPRMALDIMFNAKTQRIGARNARESLLVHRKTAERFLLMLKERLDERKVGIRGGGGACAMVPSLVPITEKDWGRRYLDYTLSLKVVDSADKAIGYTNTYNAGHFEFIVTSDYFNVQEFLNEVDAAAVYVNVPTRLTDSNEFGSGAEIGISTQKLRTRGPIGLKELTTTKCIIYGDGQIR